MNRSPYYQLKLGAAQLWPGQTLRLIARSMGGKVVGPLRGAKRPMARWEIWNLRAARIIRHLLPHLRVKRVQALLLLEAQTILSQTRGKPDLQRAVETLRLSVKEINRGAPIGLHALQLDSVEIHTPFNDSQNQATLPYLAGVMDSDGFFKIEKRRVKRMINPHYRIKIGAGQVAPSPAMDLLVATFGGTVRVRGDGRKGHRPLAHWGLFDKSAVPSLEALLPYLVIKAPQARLLLQLRELKARGKFGITEWVHPTRWHRPIKMRKRCYSKSQVRAFDRLYRTVKALHADSPPLTLPRPPD